MPDQSTTPTPPSETDWENAEITLVDAGKGEDDNADERDYGGDALLNLLVHLAEKGAGAGVTLFTSGLVISGTLLSRRDYYERHLKFLGPNNPFREVFSEMVRVIDDEPATDENEPAPNYRFVHLHNARTFTPGNSGLPANGSLMRFERDAIVGWSMGVYQSD